MNPVLKNILAVVAGLVVGSIVNGGIVSLSGSIIPPPEGVNPSDMESLKAGMHLFEPKHFIMPFLAHAMGTLSGAYLAARIAANNNMKFALAIGAFFLIGGIMAVMMLPSPVWFTVLDLGVAYLPMGWLGGRLAGFKL